MIMHKLENIFSHPVSMLLPQIEKGDAAFLFSFNSINLCSFCDKFNATFSTFFVLFVGDFAILNSPQCIVLK